MNDNFIAELIRAYGSYVWFVLLGVWGGTVHYLSRLKKNKQLRFSFGELLIEWIISGFSGILTVYICMASNVPWQMTAFFSGVAGHMGGRAIFMFESLLKDKMKKVFK